MNYIIARCRSAETAPLVEKLRHLALEAWTPMIKQRVRLPRKRRVVTLVRPALPSFLFLGESDAELAFELGGRRQVPAHVPFIVNGAVATVDSHDLSGLRRLEAIQTPLDLELVPIGTAVEIVTGPLQHRQGKVIAHSQGYLVVLLKDSTLDIKITPFLVRPMPL